ncbi:MAG: hypothetical protein QF415_08280 [Candidatus Undinarchaeales archaeon]|jgi:hypothetical protein|nr:hypothetical protein [Candidatus Undinarchaeales archaeon]MDP7494640.1 hypothetical protein [Candidatus Undinarchaeales archaeon]
MVTQRSAILFSLLAAVFLAGCTGGVDNEVCKDVESYSIPMGRMESVEEACDHCVNVLSISSQESKCLEKRDFISTLNGRRDLEAGQISYPNLYAMEDEWEGCDDLKDDDNKLKCGCCILKGKDYQYEPGRMCYRITGSSYFKGSEKTEDVPIDQYFEAGQCK